MYQSQNNPDSPSYRMVPNVGIQDNCCRDLQLCGILRRIIPKRYKHEAVTVKSQVFGFVFVFQKGDI